MKRILFLLILTSALAVLCVTPQPVPAQTNMSPDRPGFGSGSYVLERRAVNVETGFQLASFEANDQYSVGQVLLRFGLSWIELQAILNSYVLPFASAIGVYAGYAGIFASSRDQHFMEGDMTHLVTPDLQLDLNGGIELDTGDYFLGFGLATRLKF